MGKRVSGSNRAGNLSSSVSFSCILAPWSNLIASTPPPPYLRRSANSAYSVFAVFLVQLIPCHLDRFQLAFTGRARIVAELIKIDHPLPNIRKSRLQRIKSGVILGKNLGNLFRLVPLEFHYELTPSIDARRGPA